MDAWHNLFQLADVSLRYELIEHTARKAYHMDWRAVVDPALWLILTKTLLHGLVNLAEIQ
jgi:hypothetical protein